MEATENQKKKHIFLSLEELFGKPTQSLKEEFTKFAELCNPNRIYPTPAETYLDVLNDEKLFNDLKLNYIRVYTLESPLYKHINEELWKIAKNPEKYEPSEYFPRTYFFGLYKALRFLSKTQKPIYNVYNTIVYRRYIIPDNFEDVLKARFFIDYGFGSSHREKEVVLQYMHNISSKVSSKGTALLIIHCSPPDLCGYHSPISISKYSFFSAEKEVIFPPLTLFEIIESRKEKDYYELEVKPTIKYNFFRNDNEPTEELFNFVKKGDLQKFKAYMDENPLTNLEGLHEDYKDKLLYLACREGSIEIVKKLVENCAFIDDQSHPKKSTPLHAASFFGKKEIVEYLLSQGANPFLVNDFGLTPIEESKTQDIKDIFEKFIKNPVHIAQNSVNNNKFSGNIRELKYGSRTDYVFGLKKILDQASKSTLSAEFQKEFFSWIDPASEQQMNTKKCWDRALTKFPDAIKQKQALDSKLSQDEVMALILYTTAAYYPINNFLRLCLNDPTQFNPDQTFASTVYQIYSAFEKLSKNGFHSEKSTCWRGIQGKLDQDFFVPDSFGIVCYTEFGFTSTSFQKDVIYSFIKNTNLPHVVVEIAQCNSDITGHHRGVDISWCSVYANEKEVLFPPFTLFEIKERKRNVNEINIKVLPTYQL